MAYGRTYEYMIEYRDESADTTSSRTWAKGYGQNVNAVMEEFYYSHPKAFVFSVYKMLERDWGYQK